MKKYRAEFGIKLANDVDEESEWFVDILEAREVRDALRRLHDEAEIRRRRRIPSRDRFRAGRAVKRVIDLDRAQLLGVVLEAFAARELGWIKASLPLREVVAGGTDVQPRCRHAAKLVSPLSMGESSHEEPEVFTRRARVHRRRVRHLGGDGAQVGRAGAGQRAER